MISLERQTDWYRRLLDSAATAGPDIGRLDEIRRQALTDLARQPAMNRKQESWRYTSVEKLLETEFVAPRYEGVPRPETLADYSPPALDGYRLVFRNGRCLSAHSVTEGLPKQVTLGSLRACLAAEPDLISPHLGRIARQGDDFFSALNSASFDDGLVVRIGAGFELDRPIQVIHISEGMGQAIMLQPRHLILLEDGAKATLVEHFVGDPGNRYFHNNLAEILVGEGAELTHYRVQDEAAVGYHRSGLHLQQQGRSRYRGTFLSFGAGWSRTDFSGSFAGEAAECDLNGFYSVGDAQLSDFHLDLRHGVPACTSRAHFKGIAHGHGRAVFDGRVLVERQAQHSDALLKNDNLLLSRQAEIDTKPQLEIYADDVKCGHGTTVGQIEPEQLFYLRSRGISTEAAQRMLCRGFAGEIIDRIEPEAVRDYAYGKLFAVLDSKTPAE